MPSLTNERNWASNTNFVFLASLEQVKRNTHEHTHEHQTNTKHRTARTVSTASTDRSARVSESDDETRSATFSSGMKERGGGGSAIGGGSTRISGGKGTSSRALLGPTCAQRVATAPGYTPNAFVHGDQFNSDSSQRYVQTSGWRRDGYAGREWNFERLASTPLLAAAFEEFSRKALCHESVLFLSAVCRCVRLSLVGVLSRQG